VITCWLQEDAELFDWAWHELAWGNRVKASKIAKVQKRLYARRVAYFRKFGLGY
jgi:hypothetical protein